MSNSNKKRSREQTAAPAASKKLKLGDFFDLSTMDPQAKRIIEAKLLMHKRDKAREENNFGRSDELRDRINAIGVEVVDQKGGPSVRGLPHLLPLFIVILFMFLFM